jgi:glycosyltransferase involved in cell wall biosynthesis
MRILFVCPDTGIDVLGRKGAAVHVREMIAAFARAGHQVDLIAPRLTKTDGHRPATVHANVARVRVNDAIQSAKATLDAFVLDHVGESSLAKDIRRVLYDAELNAYLLTRYLDSPPDLIYVRASLLSTAGIELAERVGRPLIVEVNTPLADEQARYRSGALMELSAAVEARLLRSADVVSVVSETLAAHVVACGADPRTVVTCPNGVDAARFRPHPVSPQRRKELGVPDGPVVGFVGGLRPWHGVDVLPDVLAGLDRRGIHAHLVVAGDGPARADIETRAADLDLADRVVFLGAVDHDDMPDVIASLDVALAPYPALDHDFYFSPLKLFEYLACGVPVVASNVGQIGEIVQSERDAILTEPGDTAAVVEACVRLLSSPVLARSLAQRGARLVHDFYTWDRNVDRVLNALPVGTS